VFARFKSGLPLLLCLALCAIVLVTLNDYGLTWDESEDSLVGHEHFLWCIHPSLSKKGIDAHWQYGKEHPPLATLVGGFTEDVLHDRLGLLEPYKAFRFQVLLYVFILNFALFAWVRECWGRATAFVAVLSFFFLPRAFFDAHLGALDYPMSAMWVVTAYAFWKGLTSPRWMLAASVLMGLALLTKVNALFLWPLLLGWFAVWFRSDLWHLFRHRLRGGIKEHARVVRSLAALLLIPPAVFFIGWPWLWPQPFDRTLDYFAWLTRHVQNVVYYMGQTWSCPPWHYAFVLTAVTVPLVVLIPLFAGIFRLHRTAHRGAAAFLLLNGLVPIAAIAFASSCAYDGVRLWLPAFPFLCASSAVGVHEIYLFAERIKARSVFVALYSALFVVSVYFSVIRYHPYESSYFNEIVGGVDGAAARGFETEYWGHPYQALLPWLNAHSENAFWVPLGGSLLSVYQADGRLAPTLRAAGASNADYMVLLARQGILNLHPELWEVYKHQKPVYSVKVFDTLLAGVYDLRKGSGIAAEAQGRQTPDPSQAPATDADRAALKDRRDLQDLDLSGTQVTDAGLANLKEMKSLQRLNLTGAQVTDAGLANLKELEGLTRIGLAKTAVTDAGLANLKEMKSLQMLDLTDTRVTDGGLAQLKEMRSLQALDLTGTAVTDAGLANLKPMKGLTRLGLAKTAVTDAGLATLKEMKGLARIGLAKTAVTDAGLANLKEMKSLQMLDLAGTRVTDAGLAQLKEMRSLQALDLTGTAVTDAGLANLKQMKSLTRIGLAKTAVTDAGLVQLKEMRSLQVLDLTGTAVTDTGLADLKAALPTTRIAR
jgi:4-amino-4-deoxy-L-arabinose transferase-like glycosyltransferase/repressor of nif and glnA expression